MTSPKEYVALPAKLQSILDESKYALPSELQLETKAIFEGGHHFVLAPTGSGKSIAAILPLLSSLINKTAQAGLMLAPTREIAQQLYDVVSPLTESLPIKTIALIGGEDYKKQVRLLSEPFDLLIASPGRLATMLEALPDALRSVDYVVFDEADQLLNPERVQSIAQILKHASKLNSSTFLSATIRKRTLDVCEQQLGIRPALIQSSQSTTHDKKNYIVPCDHREHKLRSLVAALDGDTRKSIIFCHRQDQAQSLEGKLKYHGVDAVALHGGLTPKGRKQVLAKFKESTHLKLCTTDLSARGLDFDDIETVINLDVPRDFDQFTHRVGRAGRRGQAATFYNFVNPDEWNRAVGFSRRLEMPVSKLLISGVEGAYQGPKKLKSSGKAVGKKTKAKKTDKKLKKGSKKKSKR